MKRTHKIVSTLALAGLLSAGVAAPSQAFRLEADHDNGDHVFSLNQTDQKAIIAGLGFTFGVKGLAAAMLGPYITDAGLCPDNQSRYISYKVNQVETPTTPGAEITGTWCHE